jgi:hypothetical protein
MDLQQQLDLSHRLFQQGYERGVQDAIEEGILTGIEKALEEHDRLDWHGFLKWKREARDRIAVRREHNA